MKRDVIIAENFYQDPKKVRSDALALLDEGYYPYNVETKRWKTSKYLRASECSYKSNPQLIAAFEMLTGEKLDLAFWNRDFNQDDPPELRSAKWNCSFHTKSEKSKKKEFSIHNHVIDNWNRVGETGWVGIIYLTPNAPNESGLYTWSNKQNNQLEWMSPPENWNCIDTFGNVYNRLILMRGIHPHSGGNGFTDTPETIDGRLMQTFFFKTCHLTTMNAVFV